MDSFSLQFLWHIAFSLLQLVVNSVNQSRQDMERPII
jgi:hypothetical protein